MVLKEKVRIAWSMIFIILALVLAVYFIILIVNFEDLNKISIILAILTAVTALIISLLSNVKLRKRWVR